MKKILGWMAVLGTLCTLVSACSHEVESPIPKGSTAEPDLVCNEKPVSLPFSTVALHGENFTPMPSKTLESKRELILPKITLTQTQALHGEMALAKSVDIQDDPSKPADSRVHWTSEQLMSFDIIPTDPIEKRPSGVFSITVTNPDGKNKTTITNRLAVIPAPIIAALKPPAICDDQSDQQVVITGSYFLVYGDKVPSVAVGDKTYTPTVDPTSCTPLDGPFTETNVELCTSMTITIAKGDFPVTSPTKVKVVVTNPAPADCASSNDIELTINPPPKVDTIGPPSTVCEGGSSITIHGSNFQQGATVTVTCMGAGPVMASNVMVSADGMTIDAFVPSAIAGVDCEVVVTNPDGCEDRPLPHKTVKGTSGPVLFYVDPPVVFNGINTRVTLFVTSVTESQGKKPTVTMTPSGMMMPVTTLQVNYPVPNYPNRIEAIIPINQPPGVYDFHVTDESPCPATLESALTVTDTLTVTLKSVNPPFGYTAEDTAVTIFRDTMAPAPADKPFVVTPRVFLNPSNPQPTDIATPLENVSFIDPDTVTAVVPNGTPVHGYDVVLVNPDGSVGLLKDGYAEVANAPPTILTATPSSIPASSGQVVTLTGTNFDAMDVVTLICEDAMGNPVPSPTVTSQAPSGCPTGCTQKITIDGSTLAAGDVCVVRVTNPDMTYGEYSAIGVTTPSLNLNSPHVGTDMNVGRRALAAASGNATPAARFVYALGGDDGTPAGSLGSTEFAPVDLFGKMGSWTTQTFSLNAPRTLAGSVTVGRYIYLVGGDDGMGPTTTAERALILSPRETPRIPDVDLQLVPMAMSGLAPGEYHYRVSAIFDPNDTDNPGGESLASDPFTIKLPMKMYAGKKIQATIGWTAPVDSLKQPVPGVVGYRIYRSAMPNDPPGSEVLIHTFMGNANLKWTDDGSAMPGTEKPLPTGSTGAWYKLPNLGVARSGLAVAAGDDPVTAGKFYVYALLGKSGAATANTSYEYLPVTIAPNGRQTAGAAWTMGASQSAVGRWQLGAWTATNVTSNVISSPDTYIFIGGGEDGNNALVGKVEAGKISMGGDLGALSDTPKDFSSTSAGYGVCAANNQLFVFGGQGGAPSSGAKSALLVAPAPTLSNNSWNSEGLNMTHGRYLMGSSVQSAFIFLLGGQTDEPSNASKTTELVIW